MTAIFLFVFFLIGGIFGMLVTALVTYNSTDNIDWISVKDDLPCNHSDLVDSDFPNLTRYVLIKCKDRNVRIDYMYKSTDRWYFVSMNVEYWMYLPR